MFQKKDIEASADMAALFLANSMDKSLEGNVLLNKFINADFISLLHPKTHLDIPVLNIAHDVLEQCRTQKEHPGFIVNKLASTLGHAIKSGEITKLDALLFAAAALQLFVQNSYTGPSIDENDINLLGTGTCSPYKASPLCEVRSAVLKMLESDSEEAYHLTLAPELLLIARSILIDNMETVFGISDLSDINECPSSLPWWTARVLFHQQKLLSNDSSSLHDGIIEAFNAVNLDNCSGEILALYHLEIGVVFHYYEENTRSKTKFEQAQLSSGLKWSITGALGKRTKFQQKEITQLALVAESATPYTKMDIDKSNDENMDKPNALALNDDTLLETIEYTDGPIKKTEDIDNTGSLAPLDQCILLAYCLNVRNSNPEDGLTTEEMMPYVRRVLENANNWTVHTMALLLRSRLESKKSRTVERSVLQIQALVDQWDVSDSSARERLLYVYSIDLPSKWKLEKELGERFISIGVTRSALQIFEKLELWEDAISCLQMLEEESKAETLINKLLDKEPNSPKLYCLLGDLKKDPKYWEKAWDVSNHRYARAMRSLGAYYFRVGDFEKSVDCYDKALKLNALFENSWFVMGCAAMRCEKWEEAINALSRVIHIDPDNGEAWTNMASVFVHLNQKRDAWRAMREALRQHFDNSKIWENYLYISIDLGEFQEVILCISRILSIRWGNNNDEKSMSSKGASNSVDTGIVGILIDAVVKDIPDAKGNGASLYRPKVDKLIGEISSKVTNDTVLYHHFAKFYLHFGQWIKGIDYLTKAYRLLLNHPNLLINKQIFEECCDSLIKLVDALVEYGPKEEVIGMNINEDDDGMDVTDNNQQSEDNSIVPGNKRIVCSDWKYQCRSNLRTLIGRSKESFEGTEKFELLKEKIEFIKSLQ